MKFTTAIFSLLLFNMFAIVTSNTGQLVIEMSEAGGVALDISDWVGPAFQVNRIPDSQITLISTRNRDVAMIYNMDQSKIMILLKDGQKKFICDTEATLEAFLCLTTHANVFYVTDSTHCTQHEIAEIDYQIMRYAVHLISEL